MEEKLHIFYCNGTSPSKVKGRKKKGEQHTLIHDPGSSKQNVTIELPNFVLSVSHLSPRIKDLLEIAGYVFAADRNIPRGPDNAVEFQNWGRSFHFHFKVRDFAFWNQQDVKQKLSAALCFMSGDKKYEFTFQKGQSDSPMNLFDREEFKINTEKKTDIVLFSGGLDSLTGTVELLSTTDRNLCLISHVSRQPGTEKTQNKLVEVLNRDFNNRCQHFKFYCHLTGERAIDETQRTRPFLFSSMAFALATAFNQGRINFFENGMTSINFPKRQDLMNGRASRTTHPKTIGLLQEFFDLFKENTPVKIEHPYFFKTKTDVVKTLADFDKKNLISSSVSCSKRYLNTTSHTHCGKCSQCVDRRFAMYANNLSDYDDSGLYEFDFIKQPFDDKAKTSTIDFIRLAVGFSNDTIESFFNDILPEYVDLDNYIAGNSENERIKNIFTLCQKHGVQIVAALENIRSKHDKPNTKRVRNSLLAVIANQDYLKPPVQRLVEDICNKLNRTIPLAYQNNRQPADETAFNGFLNAFIEKERDGYQREYLTVKFALAKAVTDHAYDEYNLLIESKYLRGSTSISTITDGIGADMSKYPSDKHKLFIIYDPERKISDDDTFKNDWESKGNCTINIIR